MIQKIPLFFILSLLTQPVLSLEQIQSHSDDKTPYVEGELLVQFKPALKNNLSAKGKVLSQSILSHKINKFKVLKRKALPRLGVEHWKLSESQNLQSVIKALKTDPDVLLVEPNYRRYPRVARESDALNLSINALTQIGITALRQDTSRTIKATKVAILDDAFDINHPDLSSKVSDPRDALEKSTNPIPKSCIDSLSGQQLNENHGTKVMGVLAAGVGNGIGIDGASDNETRIVPIRISCNYSVSAELEALDWALAKGARVINMSYGGPEFSEFERRAIEDLNDNNVLVVTAAGNTQVDNDRIPDYPSGLDLPNIISVAAVDPANQLTNWSQYGQTSVDIAAPGGDSSIGTTYPNDQYDISEGTSFSAPFVSGVAASLIARYPEKTVFDIKAAMIASVTPLANNQRGKLVSDGVVNAVAADNLLAETVSPPLPVIKHIRIDDSNGNNNGQVDRGEAIEVVITLENIWGHADSITTTLSSIDLSLAPVTVSNAIGIKGYESLSNGNGTVTYGYGTAEFRFPVDFGIRTQTQDLMFTLDIEGTYASGTRNFDYQRIFTIDTGSLVAGQTIQSVLRKNDQDDVHYYSIYVPERLGTLTFSLSMRDDEITANNLNLLVNTFQVPQFDFIRYESNDMTAINRGTTTSTNSFALPESITIKDVPAGSTYHVAVAVSNSTQATNIIYTLNVSTEEKTFSRGAVSSCSLTNFSGSDDLKSQRFDPVLPLLLILSCIALIRSQRNARLVQKF